MDDDKLLRDLARTAREDEADERDRWDRWDRLNDGALSAEEEAQLRELAASSLEAEQAYEAFRPLSAEFRAKIVGTIGPMIAPTEDKKSSLSRFADWLASFFVDWRPADLFGRRAALGGSSLAAAAAALLIVMRLIPPTPLPLYIVAEVESGVQTERGGETGATGPDFLVAGGSFTLVAKPETAFSRVAQLLVQCFVQPGGRADGFRTAPCTPLDPDPRGSIKIQGSLPKDFPVGPATLCVVLAYPKHQPPAPGLECPSSPPGTQPWTAFEKTVEVRAL